MVVRWVTMYDVTFRRTLLGQGVVKFVHQRVGVVLFPVFRGFGAAASASPCVRRSLVVENSGSGEVW